MRLFIKDKDIPKPKVVYEKNDDMGGVYHHPDKNYKYGLIKICDISESEEEETLAHEYRHHWQYFNGVKDLNEIDYNEYLRLFHSNYKLGIQLYFTESIIEMDALTFCYRNNFHSDTLLEWIEYVHEFYENNPSINTLNKRLFYHSLKHKRFVISYK